MKMMKRVSLSSALALLSLTSACDRPENSKLDIVRGRPLAPDSPALNNVVGLSRNGISTFCTGSVVADDLVVTAAHCVDDSRPFSVVFGEPNGSMQRIEAVKVETYKPYGAAAFPNFDIAWVKLKTKVPERWKPMEILRDPARLKDAKEFRLAGYGIEKTDCRERSCSDELLEANTTLDKYYDTPRLMSLLVFKGAAELGLGGACNGDSGGPAYAKIDDKWYLIGVTNGTTPYVNPESHVNPALNCETGSDIYTFMGDYVPWVERQSAQELMQKVESNPDRKEAPFVVKGEQRAEVVQEPRTWGEWIQYPYHNEEVWNTVERLLFDLWASRRPFLQDDEQVKLWVDPEFSQANMQNISSYELLLDARVELRYADQSLDLRPLGTWTGLQDLALIGEMRSLDIDAVSRLPALKKLILNPGARRPLDSLNLKPLQKTASLNELRLNGFTPTELKTLPFEALTQLQSLQILAQNGQPEAELDLGGLKSLKELKVSSWDYAAKITLPKGLDLEKLELLLDHSSDLKWLDVESLKSIQTVEFGSEVLTDPAAVRRFHNKGLRVLVAPGSQLKVEHVPPAAFADVQELDLSGNLINGTDFLKDMPALRTVNLRDNPVTASACPAGVSCSFDAFPNPTTVAEFCRNTVDSRDYLYTPIVRMLFISQGYYSSVYNYSTCDYLQAALNAEGTLELDGNHTYTLPNGLNYDMRVLKSLVNLNNLKIRNVTLGYADALAELPALTTLDLGAVKVKNLGFIAKLSKLESMNFAEFPYTSLEGLSNSNLKILMLSSEGPAVRNAGRIQTIGAGTKLPALSKLSLRGNPLRDLNGIENLKALMQLDMTETKVSDLSPLKALIGATVFFGTNYELDTCPILYGNCQTGSKTLDGATFGSDAFTLQGSKWVVGQAIPGLGKALRN